MGGELNSPLVTLLRCRSAEKRGLFILSTGEKRRNSPGTSVFFPGIIQWIRQFIIAFLVITVIDLKRLSIVLDFNAVFFKHLKSSIIGCI
ncbi:hypothetical protein EA772_13860 [Pedobacter sp. G11]|uniref:hypothetical protein n=1 Tax=Pedobacter sp. G11 TaxID=2482728 RepID=UPI000F6006D2|nr:hypothetical protein [Pedobacter sp. G11]AZI26374.1 hypothetical protein EA772_13860 [Pedobacter sp. G11]